MKIEKIIITRQEDVVPKHEEHNSYEYNKHLIVPKEGNQCTVAIMEVPPLKAAFPYHYHVGITEVFYIISGEGKLKTQDGERKIIAGNIIVFPPGEAGSHKIYNTSPKEVLRYLDCDTTSSSDISFYPDSGKVGLIVDGKVHSFYKESDKTNYYEGE